MQNVNFIEQMSMCKDLLALKFVVQDLLSQDDANIETIYAELMSLREMTFMERAFAPKPYVAYSGSKSAVNFLLTNITTRQSEEINAKVSARERFEIFVSFVEKNIVSQGEPLILKKDIENIIKEIDRKYQLFTTIFDERKLSILRVSNTHLNCNALCYSSHSGVADGFMYINYELFLFNERKGDGWHPAFIFLHELGHILQTEISRSPAIPPKSFVQMLNQYQGPRIKQDKESAEFFADAFAIAMISIFDWKDYEPPNGFPPAMSEVYSDYMGWLIEGFLTGHLLDL